MRELFLGEELVEGLLHVRPAGNIGPRIAVENEGRRRRDVVLGLTILSHFVNVVLYRFVGNAFVDLLRSHSGDSAHLYKTAMDIRDLILPVPLRLVAEEK